jgi:prepilin-type N-terminal cleavage/methylation domain-containing protein
MKKGFMLLEVLVATAIGAILLSFECCVLIKSVNCYNKNIGTLRDSAYSDEGLIITKNLIYNDMEDVNVTGNEIVITALGHTHDNDGDHIINYRKNIHLKPDTGKVVVDYYDNYGFGFVFRATNVIAENISNMEVIKKENVLYVAFIDKEGKRVSQCFGVKKVY